MLESTSTSSSSAIPVAAAAATAACDEATIANSNTNDAPNLKAATSNKPDQQRQQENTGDMLGTSRSLPQPTREADAGKKGGEEEGEESEKDAEAAVAALALSETAPKSHKTAAGRKGAAPPPSTKASSGRGGNKTPLSKGVLGKKEPGTASPKGTSSNAPRVESTRSGEGRGRGRGKGKTGRGGRSRGAKSTAGPS